LKRLNGFVESFDELANRYSGFLSVTVLHFPGTVFLSEFIAEIGEQSAEKVNEHGPLQGPFFDATAFKDVILWGCKIEINQIY
jgi:hypothetical protein